MEAGCGVGNAMFPILEENKNPLLMIHGRDYSPRAIEVLRADPQFNPTTRYSWSLGYNVYSLPEGIAEASVDVITLCFVLSALVLRLYKTCIDRRNLDNGSNLSLISIDF